MTPSTSVVAAVDAPFPFFRAHLGVLARTVGPLILLSQLVLAPAQFAQGWVLAAPAGPQALGRMFASMGLSLGGVCVFWVLYPVVALTLVGVAIDLLDGREPSLARALREAVRPVRWATAAAIYLAASFGMFAMGVGYAVVFGFLGFAVPILLVEGVGGVESLRRSVFVATFGAGLRWWRAPWARVALAAVAWWGLTSALGILAALPLWASMGWNMWDAFAHDGDPGRGAAASPVAIAVGSLVGAGSRIVTDSYMWLVVLYVYRDVRRRMVGAELEDAVAALEDGR